MLAILVRFVSFWGSSMEEGKNLDTELPGTVHPWFLKPQFSE